MERRRLGSLLPRALGSGARQCKDLEGYSTSCSEIPQERVLFTLMSQTSARKLMKPWKMGLAFGVICLIIMAYYCTTRPPFPAKRGDVPLSSDTKVQNGAESRSNRLKITLNNLVEATETGLFSQAVLAVAEKRAEKAIVLDNLAQQAQKSLALTLRNSAEDLQQKQQENGKSKETSQTIMVDPATKLDPLSNWSSPESLQLQRERAVQALRISGLLHDGEPDDIRFNHLEHDRSKCPLRYDRIAYDDIRRGRYQPYLLGERAKPECNNCDKDHLWSHFCQFQTHGPVCPGWLKWQLSSDWVKRAEEGSPGVKDLLTLTPCDLFAYIRNRTLWLIGDSLTLEWHKAMQCFLFEFWDLELEDLKVPVSKSSHKFQGWCALMAQGARVCFIRANTGDELVDEVLPLLKPLGALSTDVVVVNFAIWQNKKEDYRGNVTRFAGYYHANRHELPITAWRDAPVQHFDTDSGDYVWPVPSLVCKAVQQVKLLQDNTLEALDPSAQIIAEGGWRNKIALPVMYELGIPVINTWNQSLPMWQYHTNFSEKDGDCTHMCHPSEYQYWVFELYQTLKSIFPEIA